ncbi:hypothetical protein [Pseudomonas citronellolis]|uniref:hypothetical protein n=1 Tax=Pseudomonas TaxID=286 RepID=UPI001081B5AB|nr:hypothetical protein [Pseudomonas citronellolis]MCP1603849.1 hypothetical protein [Pseudomonas citronellolis]MCP1640590.1 hypothetical protein [Pseudomonas citronellolis]MCP1654501.1 hypothetical protein [Pseudomonas citronellolis]MCP1663510.1 hypothetical protein [Pseudomonas citronellolis]MCP1697710.1 hypothetical protein [Pseudomonas citronellolis]
MIDGTAAILAESPGGLPGLAQKECGLAVIFCISGGILAISGKRSPGHGKPWIATSELSN